MLALTACGPLTYTIPVEKRAGSADNVDFQGMLPGIVTLTAKGDSDSVLLSSFAIGMAEPTRLRRISYAVFCLKKKTGQSEEVVKWIVKRRGDIREEEGWVIKYVVYEKVSN